MFPSLVGTLVGGGVTLLATRMTIKHQNDLEDKKRKAALDDDRRRYEREKPDAASRGDSAKYVGHCEMLWSNDQTYRGWSKLERVDC